MNSAVAEKLTAPVQEQSKGLTSAEKTQLAHCEEVIQSHFNSFKAAGEALLSIRDKRLYRENYATFEEYCRSKWDMSKTQANRLIAAEATIRNLREDLKGVDPKFSSAVEGLTESAVRPLTMLKPTQQRRVIQRAMKTAPTSRGITAKLITDVARQVAPDAFTRRRVVPVKSTGRASAPARDSGDLVRRSELLDEISKWEKAQKAVGKLDTMTAPAAIKEIRRIIGQL